MLKLQKMLPESPPNMKRPIAYQSPLWPHLEHIRSWRRARLTWREIKERLEGEPYHVHLTIQAIHSFFSTASKRKEPPIGFDSLPGQPAPEQTTKESGLSPQKKASDPDLLDTEIPIEQARKFKINQPHDHE
jgi:hypothetical protein